jgi:hypothetical protein
MTINVVGDWHGIAALDMTGQVPGCRYLLTWEGCTIDTRWSLVDFKYQFLHNSTFVTSDSYAYIKEEAPHLVSIIISGLLL